MGLWDAGTDSENALDWIWGLYELDPAERWDVSVDDAPALREPIRPDPASPGPISQAAARSDLARPDRAPGDAVPPGKATFLPESLPVDPVPPSTVRADSVPASTVPADPVPPRTVPADPVLPRSIPADSVPADSAPLHLGRSAEQLPAPPASAPAALFRRYSSPPHAVPPDSIPADTLLPYSVHRPHSLPPHRTLAEPGRAEDLAAVATGPTPAIERPPPALITTPVGRPATRPAGSPLVTAPQAVLADAEPALAPYVSRHAIRQSQPPRRSAVLVALAVVLAAGVGGAVTLRGHFSHSAANGKSARTTLDNMTAAKPLIGLPGGDAPTSTTLPAPVAFPDSLPTDLTTTTLQPTTTVRAAPRPTTPTTRQPAATTLPTPPTTHRVPSTTQPPATTTTTTAPTTTSTSIAR